VKAELVTRYFKMSYFRLRKDFCCASLPKGKVHRGWNQTHSQRETAQAGTLAIPVRTCNTLRLRNEARTKGK